MTATTEKEYAGRNVASWREWLHELETVIRPRAASDPDSMLALDELDGLIGDVKAIIAKLESDD